MHNLRNKVNRGLLMKNLFTKGINILLVVFLIACNTQHDKKNGTSSRECPRKPART